MPTSLDTEFSDTALLSRFLDDKDQAAFTELVNRHLPWVHASALRRTREPASALDVTQAVFILLAQKAHRMDRRLPLAPWLFQTLRYTVKALHRSDARRRRHETIAAARALRDPLIPPTGDIPDFLDPAVHRLPSKDRQAILLRFYQQQPLSTVAAVMQTSEDAAKKRITRALAKLRADLTTRGITAPSLALLPAFLSERLAPPATVPVASKIAAAALLPAVASSALMLARAASALGAAARLKFLLTPLAAAAIITGGIVLHLANARAAIPSAAATAPSSQPAALIAAGDDLRIVNPQPFNARLSPDGRYLLYLANLHPNGQPHAALLLQNLQTHTAFPIYDPVDRSFETVLTRFGSFTPDGSLLIPSLKPTPDSSVSRLSLNDLSLHPLPLHEPSLFAKSFKNGLICFPPRGAIFLAFPPTYEHQPLDITGLLNAVSPSNDAIVVLVPPARRPPAATAPGSLRPGPSFLLYDLTQKTSTPLPLNPRNTVLDDYEAQFTADGRYLYYRDFRDGPADALLPITRVWDRTAASPLPDIDDAVPLGPGPSASTMYLSQSPGQHKGLLLDDPAAHTRAALLPGTDIEHATGSKIVYLETSPAGAQQLMVTELPAPPPAR